MSKFLFGALIGATAALLINPKSGREMQKVAMKKLLVLKKQAEDMTAGDVKDVIFEKINEAKTSIKTTDWTACKEALTKKYETIIADMKQMKAEIEAELDEEITG